LVQNQVWVLSPVLAKLVVFIYVFNNFMDNFIVKQAKCNIIGIIMGGIQTGSNGKYSNMVCRSNFEWSQCHNGLKMGLTLLNWYMIPRVLKDLAKENECL
jgi:hypothetical protein